jgi:hypothetical protein
MAIFQSEHELDGVRYLAMREDGDLVAIWVIDGNGEPLGKSILSRPCIAAVAGVNGRDGARPRQGRGRGAAPIRGRGQEAALAKLTDEEKRLLRVRERATPVAKRPLTNWSSSITWRRGLARCCA